MITKIIFLLAIVLLVTTFPEGEKRVILDFFDQQTGNYVIDNFKVSSTPTLYEELHEVEYMWEKDNNNKITHLLKLL